MSEYLHHLACDDYITDDRSSETACGETHSGRHLIYFTMGLIDCPKCIKSDLYKEKIAGWMTERILRE